MQNELKNKKVISCQETEYGLNIHIETDHPDITRFLVCDLEKLINHFKCKDIKEAIKLIEKMSAFEFEAWKELQLFRGIGESRKV